MEGLPPAMSAILIQQLADRLRLSDPSDGHEQSEIFECIREARSGMPSPPDSVDQRRLEAAGMLVAYLQRMGALAGEDVREIAVRLLRAAAESEALASAQAPDQKAMPLDLYAPVVPSRGSATEVMGEMMLGQILLRRGHIFDEHIHQSMKVQRATLMRIGDILVKIGACSRSQVVDALNYQAAIRRVRGSLAEPEEEPVEGLAPRGTGLKLVGEALLGEILIEQDLITRRQLERALEGQKLSGARIGEILVQMGATTMEQIEQALRIQGRDRRFA